MVILNDFRVTTNNIRIKLNKIIFFLKNKAINFWETFRNIFKKWPTKRQWSCLFKVLMPQELWTVRIFITLILVSLSILIVSRYVNHTHLEPKEGGKYTEGLLGQPRYINPILSQTNDVDRDLVEIIFSGLFTYDENSNIIPELADSYSVEEDGLLYIIHLKDNVLWHDGEKVTAEDVIFTIKSIQDTEYKSPLRTIWQGVEIEKIDDLTVQFKIKNPYVPFLHNLTIGILPKHLWAGISAQNFSLADYNLYPIGSGPYQFKEIDKNKSGQVASITLDRNENYLNNNQAPFIETVIFKFYSNQEELVNAYKVGSVDGITPLSAIDQPTEKKNATVYQINLPIYHAVFFNQTESKPLSDKNVRKALSYATNKEEILNKVLDNKGTIINFPLLLSWLNHDENEESEHNFNLDEAKRILDDNDWTDENRDGIREKKLSSDEEATKLEFDLITTNWPELEQTAQLIKDQWEQIGIQVNLEIVDPITIQQEYIRPRNYQALLFGEVLGADPDPFAFWHSSQKKDPGLNLSLYQNRNADKLLEEARQTLDENQRAEKYKEFQGIVSEDIPAIFLYSSTYLYPVNNKVKGISIVKLPLPSQRFCQIENWYIKTKRINK
ncbi:MAG: ABC transporter substrate-binding protein [bacterium]